MSSITFSRIAIAATAALGAMVSPAQGQFFNDGCNTCQPIVQSCYQTVPVTEYQPVRQTVRRPVYKTAYVDQPVTVYKPVTEQRTTEVPTVRYQNVTTYRTVNRDMGRWVTQYRPNPRMAPCQYDRRPGVIGWFNRTGYQLRSAFTPKYTPIRQYQPRMMACTVPQTRRVAVRGTRTVAYNVTRMVPTQTVQRRPVRRLTYVDEQVTVMRPQTTYRTVPMGTAVAYAPSYGSSIASLPIAGSSVAFNDVGSSLAYDGFSSSGTIRNAEVIEDRPLRAAELSPEPDDLRGAEGMTPIRSARQDEDTVGFRTPRKRPSTRAARTADAGTRYQRDSRGQRPASPPATTQPAGRTTAPRAYESTTRPTAPRGTTTEKSDPFDAFNDDKFQVDGDPSASIQPASRFIRTSTARSSNYSGWRASRSVEKHAVTKSPTSRISMARR
ncbi:MAG: hypothetical protein AB8G99_06775 [Planctomycetaceae bacterium]